MGARHSTKLVQLARCSTRLIAASTDLAMRRQAHDPPHYSTTPADDQRWEGTARFTVNGLANIRM